MPRSQTESLRNMLLVFEFFLKWREAWKLERKLDSLPYFLFFIPIQMWALR
jgi:hypothetical protein